MLLTHLVIAMTAALLGAFVALSLRQSVILGYLVAGLAIGPHTPGLIGDAAVVESLAEIGIVFLTFAIGLQLSFQKLLRAGRVALGGASVQVVVTIAGGFLLGRAVGLGSLESLFFGAVLSNSSSTVLGKLLAEREQTNSGPGRTALAWSSVQDLTTVVLVAVLGVLASARIETHDLAWTIGRTVIFLGLLVPLALLVLPRLLASVSALRNREIFVLAAACIALGMSYLSSLLGISTALGAFLAGAIVGDSHLAHRILGETIPLSDVFSGLFFVSIGMLIDPIFVVGNLPLVLLCAGGIVLMKGTVSMVTCRLLGTPWPAALAIAIGLAQSGEFSLLMARLGQDLGVVSSAVFNVMLSGTALSIALLPYLERLVRPLGAWLSRRQDRSPLAHPTQLDDGAHDHIVVAGHGRVGRVIADLLRDHEVPFVVVDEDDACIRSLQSRGTRALLGNAARSVLLERANTARAAMIVVAVPDPMVARLVVDHARRLNPSIAVVARTHSDDERKQLFEMGVDEAVMGELELALELARRALESSGIDPERVQHVIDQVRRSR